MVLTIDNNIEKRSEKKYWKNGQVERRRSQLSWEYCFTMTTTDCAHRQDFSSTRKEKIVWLPVYRESITFVYFKHTVKKCNELTCFTFFTSSLPFYDDHTIPSCNCHYFFAITVQSFFFSIFLFFAVSACFEIMKKVFLSLFWVHLFY